MKMKKVYTNSEIKGTARDDRKPDPVAKLEKLPRPANWFGASKNAKKIYREVGTKLLDQRGLRAFDSYAIMMLAISIDQYTWATAEIERKNQRTPGAGYVQTFNTGASNVSVEITLREKAHKQIIELMGKFGLTLKDRLTMNQPTVDPNQTNMFDVFKFSVNQ